MARLLNDESSQYLMINQAVLTGTPISVSCLFYADEDKYGTLFWLGDKDVLGNYYTLLSRSSINGNVIQAQTRKGGITAQAVTTSGWSLNTWHQAGGVWASATDRRAFIDGGSKGTNSTNMTPSDLDRTAVGVHARNGIFTVYYSGRIAEMAVWDAALTDEEWAILGKKYSPLLVRPQNIIAYWPLVRDADDDIVGGYNLTPYNAPSIADHPPMIYPIKGIGFESASKTVEPSALALDLTLPAPAIVISSTVSPNSLALDLMLPSPTLFIGTIITPDSFSLTLTEQTPSVNFNYSFVIDSTLALALTLPAPTIIISSTMSPDSLALALTLPAPTLIVGVIITPDSFSLALAEQIPDVNFDYTYAVDSALALSLALESPLIPLPLWIIYPDEFSIELTVNQPRKVWAFYPKIPPFMHKDIIDPYSGGAWLWLCEIAVPGYKIERIARNTEDVNYGGEEYEKFNIQIGEQMFSGDGSIPRVTLRIFQDMNRKIEDLVNATEGALGAEVKLVRVCEKFLDTPVAALEADYENLASESDSEWVTFTLGIPNPLTQRFPLRMYSSSICPWATPTLFKGPECQYTGADTSCSGTYDDCYTKGNAVHWGGELGLDPNVVKL